MKGPLAVARAEGRTTLSEIEASALLVEHDLRVSPSRQVGSLDELDVALQAVEPPWAMKIVSPDLPHQTDVGGVALGLKEVEAARNAFRDLTARVAAARPAARLQCVLVQHQVEGAVAEMLLGVSRDKQFGPVVLVGFGGIFAEVIDEVAMRVAPEDVAEAGRMLRELKGFRILTAFRGRPAGDVEALADAVMRLSRLASELEDEVCEVDINPALVLPAGKGVIAVDALVALR